ncbi:unnamed protein product [Darwinula stevensoni]|uniref:Uncharacterized protein n=1 Tax=Darwinula stevensoni TaxID=69355 RepID=A0A7R8ZXL5_9CRUS|nr:unnamed protein product [Darwinula stevensoni]CAG0878697.1 unnamed protein product [Darwinula stevensoni]
MFPSSERLMNLTIKNSRLREFPFEYLSILHHLNVLNLDENNIETVPALQSGSIETLNLKHNKITRVVEIGWVTPNLKNLYLSFNSLASVPVLNINSLEILDLSSNNITSVEDNGWITLNLREVYLQSNSLTSVPAFKGGSIETLSLSFNKISRVDVNGWATPNLKNLDLSSNLLTSVPALKIDSLLVLSLSSNRIGRVDGKEWATLNLRKLYLMSNPLVSLSALQIDRLEILSISFNKVTRVDENGWATPNLKKLYLHNYWMTPNADLESNNLGRLNFKSNKTMKADEAGWLAPNGNKRDIRRNPLLKFPSSVITSLEKLEEFSCSFCNFGPTLSGGLLKFQSNSLKMVSLQDADISKLEPEAITGLRTDTNVDLSWNNISTIDERIFRPILEKISSGLGLLDIQYNPIKCDCNLAWLAFAPVLLSKVEGTCENGTDLKDLDLCPPLPPLTLIPPSTAPAAFQDPFSSLLLLPVVGLHREDETGNKTECFRGGKYRTGSVVKYFCARYYVLRGPRFRTCGENEEWTGPAPFCEPECGMKMQVDTGGWRPVHTARGREAPIGEWPWMVAIYDNHEFVKDIICGGALIGERWVLTAAHCVVDYNPFQVRDKDDYLVYLGKHYRNDSKDDGFVQIRKVAKIIPNMENKRFKFRSDLALLKLNQSVKLTNGVQVVCLPTKEYQSRSNLLHGVKGWLAGWGEDASNFPSEFLREVLLSVHARPSCENQVGKVAGKIPELTDKLFCAGHQPYPEPSREHETVCIGDSGSPMTFQADTKQETSPWVVEGILSHTYAKEKQKCSEMVHGQFGIFITVHKFIDWIKETMEKNAE